MRCWPRRQKNRSIIGKGINKAYEDDPVLFPGFLERLIHSHAERKRLFLKIESVCTDFVSHATPDYLKTLKNEFPDAKERGTAYALILLKIAGVIKQNPHVLYDYDEELFHNLAACSIPGSILDTDVNRLLLTLARLYYLKNAFRKAQAILQIAYDRAPHDVRVKESRALALKRSGEAESLCRYAGFLAGRRRILACL